MNAANLLEVAILVVGGSLVAWGAVMHLAAVMGWG